jgi:hypothetical protein
MIETQCQNSYWYNENFKPKVVIYIIISIIVSDIDKIDDDIR